MTSADMLEALGSFEVVPAEAIAVALADWDAYGPRFRALLRSYVAGDDTSESTERALYGIVHLLGEKADTAAFPNLCLLWEDRDKFSSVYGPDAAGESAARILASTFNGDPAPLIRLIGSDGVDDYLRGDALLVLAYLACHGQIAEDHIYRFLSELPASLPDRASDVWYAYAKAVAALGFAGLSGATDEAYKRDFIDKTYFPAADFWRELRASQSAGRDVSGPEWDTVRPIGSAAEQLQMLAASYGLDPQDPDNRVGYAVQEPLRNLLRSVGRNDPCPCGSGQKYKKCCLQVDP